MAPSCKLKLARFSPSPILQDRAKCDKASNYIGEGGHHKEKTYSGGDTANTFLMGATIGVGTPNNIEKHDRLTAQSVIIVPLHGSILQAETCQILSLAENSRWSPSVAITHHLE